MHALRKRLANDPETEREADNTTKKTTAKSSRMGGSFVSGMSVAAGKEGVPIGSPGQRSLRELGAVLVSFVREKQRR